MSTNWGNLNWNHHFKIVNMKIRISQSFWNESKRTSFCYKKQSDQTYFIPLNLSLLQKMWNVISYLTSDNFRPVHGVKRLCKLLCEPWRIDVLCNLGECLPCIEYVPFEYACLWSILCEIWKSGTAPNIERYWGR